MKFWKAEGIVIKRKNIGEADRILTVLTKNHGKISVKAKGVRKITSKRASHIELFNHSSFSFYKTPKMPLLIEVQIVNEFSPIKATLKKIGFAYYICELLDGLCPENQENGQVFTLALHTLHELSVHSEEKSQAVITQFEKTLMELLGYGMPAFALQQDAAMPFIESILERKLKTKYLLPHLA